MSSASSLTQSIICYLNMSGFVVWRNNTVGIWDAKKQIYRKNKAEKKGISDIIGFRKSDGKHIDVEVKAGSDKMSVHQLLHHDQLKTGHCISIVAKNFDQFLTEIKPF